jgi:predicted O-linked N-acetylglucosamine transferase (SPINDLY family)
MRLEDALESYNRALSIQPDHVDAMFNRGGALTALKRLDEALESYSLAIAIKPDCEFLLGLKSHSQARVCNWQGLTAAIQALALGLDNQKRVTIPFPLLGLLDQPQLQLRASQIYAAAKFPMRAVEGVFNQRTPHEKIRIGYYSADFHNHATCFLMAELLEAHDKQKFVVYGFSFGPNFQDEMRQRVRNTFDHFIDVSNKADHEVAQLSRELQIDIAVDLKGYTQDSRTGIFAARCAPIQVNYLGYPGTMAAPYMDYLIADKTLIPIQNQPYYTEKIVYLPHTYQANDSGRVISDKVFTRQEVGLPEVGFVFCCFNNNWKIMPPTFDGWMRLLTAVSGSVLWLLEDNATTLVNLRKEAALRGVDPNRLIFAKRMKLEEHLARHALADLFMDTLPYNAHTTASDALWAGLPVLTLVGESFAARVAASLLNAMDLPELITHTQEQYEEKAIELANNPDMLRQLKEKIAHNRLRSPLFKGQLLTRHIEAAYENMLERYLLGQEPEHIDIAP